MKIGYLRYMHTQETSGFFIAQGIVDWLLSGDPAANLDNIVWEIYPCTDPKAVYNHYQYSEIESEIYDSGKIGSETFYDDLRERRYHAAQIAHMWNNEHQIEHDDRESYEYCDPLYDYTDIAHFPDEEPESAVWQDWIAFWPHWYEWGTDSYWHRNGKYWQDRMDGFLMINEIPFYGKDSDGDVVANIRYQGKQWARAVSQVYLRFQQEHNYFTDSHPCGTIDLTGAVLLPKPEHFLLENLSPVSGTVQVNKNGDGDSIMIFKRKHDHGLGMKAGESVAFTIPDRVNSFKANAAMDDATPDGLGLVEFVVSLNSNEIWRSRPLEKYQSQMAHIFLSETGELILSVEGSPGVLGNWAGARFTTNDPDFTEEPVTTRFPAFSLPGQADILSIYNVSGKKMHAPTDVYGGLNLPSLIWNGIDMRGNGIARSIYVLQLLTEKGELQYKKAVIAW
jgi:hypothetical protein